MSDIIIKLVKFLISTVILFFLTLIIRAALSISRSLISVLFPVNKKIFIFMNDKPFLLLRNDFCV